MTSIITTQLDYIHFLQGLAFLLSWILCRSLARSVPGVPWRWLGHFCAFQILGCGVDFVAFLWRQSPAPSVTILIQLAAFVMLLLYFRGFPSKNNQIPGKRIFLTAAPGLSALFIPLHGFATDKVWFEVLLLAASSGTVSLLWEYYLSLERKKLGNPVGIYRWMQAALIVHFAAIFAATYGVTRYVDSTNEASRRSHFELADQLLHSLYLSGNRVLNAYASAPEIVQTLRAPRNGADLEQTNRILDEMAKLQPKSIAFLITPGGSVLTSSNRGEKMSVVGQKLNDRPYFQAALSGREGLFLGIGNTTREPGLFLSKPVRAPDGTFYGVLALKLSLVSANLFGSLGDPGFLAQENGVVLVTNRPKYVGTPLVQISQTIREGLLSTRQFPTVFTEPLLPFDPTNGATVRFEGRTHHFWKVPTGIPGSSLILLSRDQSLNFARASVLGLGFLISLGVISLFFAREKEIQFQQNLAASEKRYRSIFEDNLAVLLELSLDGKITNANKAAAEFYGYPHDTLKTFTIFEINVSPAANNAFKELKSTGSGHFQFQHRTADGSIKDVEVYSMLLPSGDRVLSIVHDITDRIAMEKQCDTIKTQLFHSEKLASLGTLAAGVGHEINNPLAIISGFASMLRSRIQSLLTEPESLKSCISILDKQELGIKRIAQIVQGLRTYARSDSNAVELVNIHETVQETLSLIGQIFHVAGIRIQLKLDATCPSFQGNKGQFQQVLMNLLTNARDAVEKNAGPKDITICTVNRDTRVIVEVTDNGTGISETDRNRIFDPFFTTKAPGKGTGLGLPICRSLVETFGGRINVTSELGAGTTFSAEFPVKTMLS